MKNLFNTSGMLLLVFSIAACKKDETVPAPVPPSTAELLTVAPWIRTAAVFNNEENNYEYDLYTIVPDCIQDNKFVFTADKSHIVSEGDSKCGTESPDTVQRGYWLLADNEETLRLQFESEIIDYQIFRLTRDSMILQQLHETAIYKEYYTH